MPCHVPLSCLQECSLLCDDYARLGFDRFVMDPSVRVVRASHGHKTGDGQVLLLAVLQPLLTQALAMQQ
jgi:hypothetical protein